MCTDNAGNASAPKSFSFQYDATAPSASAAPARGADANGWYNHPVDVAFTGSDGVSGLDGCSGGTYAGPDSATASVAGSCRDKAGNTATAGFALRYDATPPTVSAPTPNRQPDANGWYNHKVQVAFTGADALSGIASCDTPSYDKPNDPTAKLTGSCRDNAGNVSAPASFAFKFDSMPPKLSDATVSSVDGRVTLAWKASSDVATMKIVRTAGGTAPVTVYDGKRATTFTDKTAKNGGRYTYVLTASDPAGNDIVLKTLATPSSALIAPRQSARVRGAATLRWRAVKTASYYNVQVWLQGRKVRKVLTTWPSGPTLKLPLLGPGTYTWLVWPGIGPRSGHRYGPLVGKSTFVVTR